MHSLLLVISIIFFIPTYAHTVIKNSIVALDNPAVQRAGITYRVCMPSAWLSFAPFPFAQQDTWYETHPTLPPVFIVSVPGGSVWGRGYVCYQGLMIKELLWDWSPLRKQQTFEVPVCVTCPERYSGTVVTLAQEGQENYYHWMTEVLPKLALLAKQGVHFDWLYVPQNLRFMKESLSLWGIAQEKIIPASDYTYIQADTMVAVSAVSKSIYTPHWVVDCLRATYLPLVASHAIKPGAKKVFISRKKASFRRIINEDEVFSLFKAQGFVRYCLEDLSLLEQVALFHGADVIVAPHGAGLVNMIFCKQGALIVEIFQEHQDETFWYLSQTVGLHYVGVKTTEFKTGGGYTDTIVPLDCIRGVIDRYV